MPTELDNAYRYCQDIAKSNAKNFYYAFRTLPINKRKAIYAVYAFCRYCDDIADEPRSLSEKHRLFKETQLLLNNSFNRSNTTHPVFKATSHTAQTIGIPLDYFNEVLAGVKMDLTKNRYQNFTELREYCYRVASVVGLICIEIFGYSDPKARNYAIDLGLAMQLTNIMRDIKEDVELNRIYLPMNEISSFGYSETELLARSNTSAFKNVMQVQTRRARQYFENGRKLIPLISRDSRACPATLLNIYNTILDRIEMSDFDVFTKRIGLNTAEKLIIMAKLWATNLIPMKNPLHE